VFWHFERIAVANAARQFLPGGTAKQASSSFLKKRTKKLLLDKQRLKLQ
jgi:hypothetical protein